MIDDTAIINTTSLELDHSHVTPEWFGALAEAQSRTGNAKKESDNLFFKSKYADLAEVLDTIKAVFPSLGLSISQWSTFDGARAHVYTMLGHKSGGYVIGKSSCVPAKTDAQGVGMAWTYLRRYSAAAVCGIAQEDDDGNAGAHAGKPAAMPFTASPYDGVKVTDEHMAIAKIALEFAGAGDHAGAADYLRKHVATADDKVAVWSLLPSNVRSAIKKLPKEPA